MPIAQKTPSLGCCFGRVGQRKHIDHCATKGRARIQTAAIRLRSARRRWGPCAHAGRRHRASAMGPGRDQLTKLCKFAPTEESAILPTSKVVTSNVHTPRRRSWRVGAAMRARKPARMQEPGRGTARLKSSRSMQTEASSQPRVEISMPLALATQAPARTGRCSCSTHEYSCRV